MAGAAEAFNQSQEAAAKTGSLSPPLDIMNAPIKMKKDMWYGANYAYDHDDRGGLFGQNCSPDGMERARYYLPVGRGYEREIAERLAYLNKLRARKKGDNLT